MFPFLHSTPVYPEWPIAALGHVSKDVSSEVADALLNLQAHSIIGHELEHCELDNAQNVSACKDAVMASEHRCDTTRQLAFYAFEIVKESQLAGFRPPRSYFEVRTMHEAAGFAQQNDKGEWQCTRAATMYDGIDCPDDHYKIPEDEFAESCAKQGLTCGEGFECYCKPCIKAFEVNIYEKGDGGNDKNLTFDGEGCSKMSVCGDVEQTHFVTFRAIDNLERVDAEVTARVHLGQTTQEMEVTKVPGKEFTYEFGFSQNEIGVAVMEIFFDGEQIPGM